MALTQAQKTLIQKAQAAGGGELGTGLTDEACSFIVATIIRDLSLSSKFPELPEKFPDFFQEPDPRKLSLSGMLGYTAESTPEICHYFGVPTDSNHGSGWSQSTLAVRTDEY